MTNNSEQGVPAIAAKPAPGAVSRIRNYFLTGLIVAGPVAVTLWLIWWFVTWVDNLVRPFIPVTYRPETYLPVQHSGARPDHRLCGADAAWLPHRQPGRPQARRPRRESFAPHADRAADLPHRQADLPDAVLQLRIELPPRRPGRISVARHVVAGFPDPIAERGNFGAAAGDRARLRLHAVHAEPDHRLLLLRAAARRDRSRHHGRGGDAASDVGGHHPARRRRCAEAARRRWPKPRAPHKPCVRRRPLPQNKPARLFQRDLLSSLGSNSIRGAS